MNSLNKYLEEYRELNSANEYKPVAVGRYGIRLRENIYSKELAKDYSKNKVIRKGTLTVGMGSVQIDIGILSDEKTYSVSPAYHTYKIQGIDYDYLRYCLQCRNRDMFLRYVKRGSRQGKSIDLKRWLTYKIPVYSPDVQKELVEKLDKVKDIIDKRKKQLEELENLVNSRFVEMFGDLADPKCVWNQVKLINVCKTPNDVKCGPFGTQLNKNEYQKKGVAVWEIPQINDEFASEPIHFLTEKKAKILESYSVIAGDIVMSRKGNIGKCAVFPEKYEKGIIHSDVLRIRVDAEQVNSQFMMRQLHYSRAIKHQIGTVSSGAIMAGINVTKLKQIYVHIPPIDLQNQFATFVHQVNKSKFVIHKFLYCTTHNTKSIIKPRLNTKESGKIRGGKPHADEF